MKHYIRVGSSEQEISPQKLREDVDAQLLDAYTQVRREGQEFSYPVAQLLGIEPPKPFVFLCPLCYKQVQSTVIEMQLSMICGTCGETIQVPDRRPPMERQRTRLLKVSRSTARVRITQGLLLAGSTLGLALVALGNSHLPILLPIGLGIIASYLLISGLRARQQIQRDERRVPTASQDERDRMPN